MISSIVFRPLGACVSAPKKARSRPVAPQSLRRASRACTPSLGSLSVESFSSSALISIPPPSFGVAATPSTQGYPRTGRPLGPLQGCLVAAGDPVPAGDVPESPDVLGPPGLVRLG